MERDVYVNILYSLFFKVIIIVFHTQLLTGVIDTTFAKQFSVVLINTSNK